MYAQVLVMFLLGGLPQLIYSGLHIVSVWLRALGSPDVGVRIEHLAGAGSIWVWIGVDVTIAL